MHDEQAIQELEDNLQFFARTNDSDLFGAKIYLPLKYIALSIVMGNIPLYDGISIKKCHLNETDREAIVQDMVSHCAEHIHTFRLGKGNTCTSYSRMLMSQRFIHEMRKRYSKKRDESKTVYLEDVLNDQGEVLMTVEDKDCFTVDKVVSMWSPERIKMEFYDPIEQKIARTILKCIQSPEMFDSHWNSFVKDIAKRCKVSPKDVRNIIKKMSEKNDL